MSDKKTATATSNSIAEMTNGVAESGDKIERIRELIFGAHIRDYGQKFDLLSREISRLNREIERLNQQLRDQESATKRQLRDESERLSNQLQEQDRRQTQQLQEFDRRQTTEVEALEQKHGQRMQEMDRVALAGDRDLLEKLRELTDQLNDLKVDRVSLGDLLVNLGSSLKQNAPGPLTGDLDVLDQLSAELA
jgi:predicted RNase H-like nuclease (RuvC/YqgF family)